MRDKRSDRDTETHTVSLETELLSRESVERWWDTYKWIVDPRAITLVSTLELEGSLELRGKCSKFGDFVNFV